MPHAPTVTVLLISSWHLGWVGIRTVLQDEPGMGVVGEAQRTEEALALAVQEQPMVIMVATDIGENKLLSLVPALRHDSPSSHLILLGDIVAPAAQRALIREGIEAYLDWSTLTPALVLSVVITVAQGEGQVLVASRAVLAQLLDAMRHSDEDLNDASRSCLADLTNRERQALDLLTDDVSYKQIARRMGIADGTVKSYMADIRTRWGLDTTKEAVALYRRLHKSG